MKIKKPLKNKGFTMMELLIYISGLIVIGSVIIMLILHFFSLYKEIVASPRADRTGLLILDRLSKEIRSAKSISMLESQFNTTEGILTIIDQENNQKKFFVENGVIKYEENGQAFSVLSSNDFDITNFNFQYVDTSVSEGVRFSIEISYEADRAMQTKSFVGFALVRESYE